MYLPEAAAQGLISNPGSLEEIKRFAKENRLELIINEMDPCFCNKIFMYNNCELHNQSIKKKFILKKTIVFSFIHQKSRSVKNVIAV